MATGDEDFGATDAGTHRPSAGDPYATLADRRLAYACLGALSTAGLGFAAACARVLESLAGADDDRDTAGKLTLFRRLVSASEEEGFAERRLLDLFLEGRCVLTAGERCVLNVTVAEADAGSLGPVCAAALTLLPAGK